MGRERTIQEAWPPGQGLFKSCVPSLSQYPGWIVCLMPLEKQKNGGTHPVVPGWQGNTLAGGPGAGWVRRRKQQVQVDWLSTRSSLLLSCPSLGERNSWKKLK